MITECLQYRARLLIVLLSVLLALLGCTTSSRVFVDSDPAHSFSAYKTFSWIGERPMLVSGDQGPNALVTSRLMAEIQAGFENHGYLFVQNPTQADFVVSFTVGAREMIDIREYRVDEYFGPYGNGAWHRDRFGYILPGAPQTTVTETKQYTQGTLAIDVFDVAERKPVWHAGTKKRLSNRELGEGSSESIRAAVTQVLKEFPYKTI